MEYKTLFTEKKIKVVLNLKKRNTNLDQFRMSLGMTYAYTHKIIKELRDYDLLTIGKSNNKCFFCLTDRGVEVRDMLRKIIYILKENANRLQKKV